MEEEIKQEQQEEEKPILIKSAIEAAEKLKMENERMEKNIKQLEQLQSYEALGGRTQGRPQEVKEKEIDPKEYAKMVLAGKFNRL